ncbi:MAG TPA: PAS domain S-box protein [Gemmatimonadaceae bacterium]|nr:PAS domain S-box protein [Gemmatimonadaceae bacterium]
MSDKDASESAAISALKEENAALRERAVEAEEMLRAIRRGEVDALVVEGPSGPRIFTLQGQDADSNRFRGEILAQVSEAVFAFDHDLRITYLNPSAERQYAVTASEVLGRWSNDVYRVHWPDPDAEQEMREALRGSGMWRGEQLHVLHDGRRVPVELNVTTFRDGPRDGMVAVVRDITARKRTESMLHESEERLRLALDAGQMATWDWNVETGALVWSAQHFRILGLSVLQDEPTFELFLSRVHADDRDRIAGLIDDVLTIGGEFNHEYRVLGRNDETRWVMARGRVERETRTTRFYGVMLDITERVTVEAALRQNATLFSKIIEQAPGGVYVVDSELRIVALNRGARPVFANVGPVLGHSLVEVLSQMWGEKTGRELSAVFAETLRTGERYMAPDFADLRADIGEMQVYEWETQRVTLPDGQYGVVCYFIDVTERHRTEVTLRDNDQRMRLATEATAVGIWEWNLKSNRIRWDAQMFRTYGMTPTDDGYVDYDTWKARVNPEELRVQEELLRDLIARGEGHSAREFRIRRLDDNQLRTVRAVETVRIGSDGEPDWVVGTNLDITDRKRDEQALRDADRRKDEFLATLAHELRNPLAPMRAAAQMLHLTNAEQPQMRWATDVIDRQIKQMIRLIDDLMDVSRINQGKVDLKRELVSLASVLQGAVETSRPLIDENHHRLSVTMPAAGVMVDGDLTRLSQVFLNLLNNAAKYTERGGHIELRAEQQKGDIVVSVRDSGIGIPADALPNIFGMFSQVEGALSRSHGGLGIGLFLVRRLVEMHGGTVSVSSDGIGCGSEFVVRLPIVVEAETGGNGTRPAGLLGALPESSLRILIVDDNRDAAESLERLLSMMGNTTRAVHDGESAIALVPAFDPHVVLLDVGLPRMNGYDVARAIRSLPCSGNTVLVAVTGWGQAEDKRRSADAGFDHHLVKPVEPSTLLQILAGVAIMSRA